MSVSLSLNLLYLFQFVISWGQLLRPLVLFSFALSEMLGVCISPAALHLFMGPDYILVILVMPKLDLKSWDTTTCNIAGGDNSIHTYISTYRVITVYL